MASCAQISKFFYYYFCNNINKIWTIYISLALASFLSPSAVHCMPVPADLPTISFKIIYFFNRLLLFSFSNGPVKLTRLIKNIT